MFFQDISKCYRRCIRQLNRAQAAHSPRQIRQRPHTGPFARSHPSQLGAAKVAGPALPAGCRSPARPAPGAQAQPSASAAALVARQPTLSPPAVKSSGGWAWPLQTRKPDPSRQPSEPAHPRAVPPAAVACSEVHREHSATPGPHSPCLPLTPCLRFCPYEHGSAPVPERRQGGGKRPTIR